MVLFKLISDLGSMRYLYFALNNWLFSIEGFDDIDELIFPSWTIKEIVKIQHVL